ncbi:Conserved secreted protein [Caenorhabditis elegans]|uniref:Conserved secreted protein n=1 Tax=Caenorhabditis elegans TaxID=6239 RepID=O76673_CAEEL|nr:Conserved secreted protein [Caenorhabditis elegans]CCD72018.1 Conserved secreted protein [Caenorhabditis elegans]|eukprot:NP_497629.1 Uncharacterized protein CELE_H34I24.1 [Caenorhabditis elegans]
MRTVHLLVLFVLFATSHAQEDGSTATEGALEVADEDTSTTQTSGTVTLSPAEFEEEEKKFVEKLNEYRREVAKKMKIANMNELTVGAGDKSDYSINSKIPTFDEILKIYENRAEKIIDKATQGNTKLCENDPYCYGQRILNPGQKTIKCKYECKEEGAGDDCADYKLICNLYPLPESADLWWNKQTNGEAGSACDADRHADNGLCADGAPTTTTTTTVKPPTTAPAVQSNSRDVGELSTSATNNYLLLILLPTFVAFY